MPDITKCSNNRCARKTECYRFTSEPSDANQAFDIFVPDVNVLDGFSCDMYLQTKHRKDVSNGR